MVVLLFLLLSFAVVVLVLVLVLLLLDGVLFILFLTRFGDSQV